MPAILELSVMPSLNRAHTRRIGGISPFSFSWMCADSVSCWFNSLTKVGYRDRNALSNSVKNSLFSFSVLVEEERRLSSSLLWLVFYLSYSQGAQFAVSLYVLITQVNIHLYQSFALLIGILQFVVDEMQLSIENFHFCGCCCDFIFLLFQQPVLLADEQAANTYSK